MPLSLIEVSQNILDKNPELLDTKTEAGKAWKQVKFSGWHMPLNENILIGRFWAREDTEEELWFSMDARLDPHKPWNEALVLTLFVNARLSLDWIRDNAEARKEAIRVGRERWGLK